MFWDIIWLIVVQYPHPQMFNVCIDARKGPSYYPQNITFKFYICHLRITMLLECYLKNYIKPGTDRPQSVGSRTLFYHMSMMLQIFIEDSGNLKNHRNVKSINNTTASHLVSCRVILRLAMQKNKNKNNMLLEM